MARAAGHSEESVAEAVGNDPPTFPADVDSPTSPADTSPADTCPADSSPAGLELVSWQVMTPSAPGAVAALDEDGSAVLRLAATEGNSDRGESCGSAVAGA